MNTKFFFSAIAMFAITSVANAAPLIRRAEAVRVNEEVATSAVIKGAQVSGVNEEVAKVEAKSGIDFRGGIVNDATQNSDCALKAREDVKSGIELAKKIGPRVNDTEKSMEVAIFYFNIKRPFDCMG